MKNGLRSGGRCVGCGGVKSAGAIVCWDCFKYRKDVTPFKYFEGTLEAWISLLPGAPGLRKQIPEERAS